MKESFKNFQATLLYTIASGFVLFGIYLILKYPADGINRDIGLALITFFTALILIGATKKNN